MAYTVSDQRRPDRYRPVCAAQDRRDSGVRRGKGPKPGPHSADRGVAALAAPEILLAAGSILGGFGFAYMGNTYLTVYAHFHLGYTRRLHLGPSMALAGLASSITFVALSASSGPIEVGRRRMMLLGWAGCVPWALVVMPLMDTGKPVLYSSPLHRRHDPRSSRESAPDLPEPFILSCSPPVTATADRHWRSTPPGSSAARCRR